jgi:hypothetical protein
MLSYESSPEKDIELKIDIMVDLESLLLPSTLYYIQGRVPKLKKCDKLRQDTHRNESPYTALTAPSLESYVITSMRNTYNVS